MQQGSNYLMPQFFVLRHQPGFWNRYNARADFCMPDFWETDVSFRLIMVAYNVMSLFRFAA